MSSLISALFLRWNAQVGGDQSQYDPADQVAETSDQHPVALEASPALWIGQGNPRLDREIDELAFVGTYGLPRLQDEAQGAWHAVQFVLATLLEGDARAGNEVLDGAGHDHLARAGRRGGGLATLMLPMPAFSRRGS
jgi:hypothetical protein